MKNKEEKIVIESAENSPAGRVYAKEEIEESIRLFSEIGKAGLREKYGEGILHTAEIATMLGAAIHAQARLIVEYPAVLLSKENGGLFAESEKALVADCLASLPFVVSANWKPSHAARVGGVRESSGTRQAQYDRSKTYRISFSAAQGKGPNPHAVGAVAGVAGEVVEGRMSDLLDKFGYGYDKKVNGVDTFSRNYKALEYDVKAGIAKVEEL